MPPCLACLHAALWLASLKFAAAEIARTGFQNRYYQGLAYHGSRVLEHNETGRFTAYLEVLWSQSSAVDSEGRIWVVDKAYHQIVFLPPTTRYVSYPALYTHYAGKENTPGHKDGSRLSSRFNGPSGIALYTASDGLVIYVSDTNNHCLRRLTLANGRTNTIIGKARTPGLLDGPGIEARLKFPSSLGLDSDGRNLILLDNGRVLRHVMLPEGGGIARIITLVEGACRLVSRFVQAESIVMRRIGCHTDWLETGAMETPEFKFQVLCVGHEATCGPRNHPALADRNSHHLVSPHPELAVYAS